MTKKLFYCDPKKNSVCSKEGCFINGGGCVLTSNAEYRQNEPEPAQYNLVLSDLNWFINNSRTDSANNNKKLNKVKQELTKVSQEFEVYKKAFDLACKRLGAMSDETGVCDAAAAFCEKSCRRAQGACWRDYFLKKAREA